MKRVFQILPALFPYATVIWIPKAYVQNRSIFIFRLLHCLP